MSQAEIHSEKTPGVLAESYAEILGLQTSLARSDPNIRIIPRLFKRIIRDECWREWLTPEGEIVQWNAADFRQFLTSKRPKGCETSLHVIEQILRGTDVWESYLEMIRGEPGATAGEVRNPYGRAGKKANEINRNPITVNQKNTDVIASLSVTPRDYSREAKTGTSVSYAVRRLGKERPDLLERVKSGELKPKTAMREAGFVPDEFSIPVEPQSAARRILKRFEGEPLAELVRVLARHAGLDLVRDGELVE